MVKLMVLYGPPEDLATFEKYYIATHTPLAEKIPGLRKLEFSRMATLNGSPSPYHLIAELSFDSDEALRAAFASDEGKTAAADVVNFATGGATMPRCGLWRPAAPGSTRPGGCSVAAAGWG